MSSNTLGKQQLDSLSQILNAEGELRGDEDYGFYDINVMNWDYGFEKDSKTGEEFLVAYRAVFNRDQGYCTTSYSFEERLTEMPSFKIPMKHFDRKKVAAWTESRRKEGRVLFHDLVDRGLNTEVPILFVVDGGKAIRKAIRKLYGDNCAIQRCTIHKLRNIEEYLPKQYHGELRRRMKHMHSMSAYDDALKEHDSLLKFLESINHQAAESLREANFETLTAIKLRAPELLRNTIMNTNHPIESIFDRIKTNCSRVKNWQNSPDQVLRWAATFETEAEKHFRTIKGFKQIPLVIAELENLNLQEKLEIA